ncbi:MAG TPA: hypothetical protein VK918_10360 [Pyrinomonadaceae bacterium]|nr:hypothetical protein [Pyrinomonadaceae bacterium]
MLVPFFDEVDLDADDFLVPPDDPDFEAVDFLAVLAAGFFAPDLDAVDFLAVLDAALFAPDFVPLDDFEVADFFVLELPLLVPVDFFAVEDFFAPPLVDLDVDELVFFFAPVFELFVEVVDFFVPLDLLVPDFDVDFDPVPPDLDDDLDFAPDDFDEVEPALLPDEGIRFAEVAVATSPSEIIASPAPCSAPAAAPAAALATTSPALAAAALSTSLAASFAFCTNPFLLEPFFAAILLFLL